MLYTLANFMPEDITHRFKELLHEAVAVALDASARHPLAVIKRPRGGNYIFESENTITISLIRARHQSGDWLCKNLQIEHFLHSVHGGESLLSRTIKVLGDTRFLGE